MWRWILLACLCHPSLAADPMRVVYPATEAASDHRYDDLLVLLRTALDKTVDRYGPYRLEASRLPMEEERSLEELRRGGGIDVAWSSTSALRERQLLPVRVDLRKGLLGYRIALIDGRRQPEFDQVRTLAGLGRFQVGQGKDWGDVQVYRAAAIRVSTGRYDSLFGMLSNHRFDLLPRSVLEVFGEYQQYHERYPNLEVEQHLLIYYPWPYYFFCQRDNPRLAARLQLGLQRMRADGSFDAIFWQYHRDVLRQARMSERRLIVLSNPLLPPDTPLGDATMWFDPQRDRAPSP
ncbi:amino acid ABC transporter substrate-binding protein [Chromobacterium sp. ATCC 53434]|uniref:transporter substrate-binding domain-containing protein n=1 Tax=Chromobacterium TaxID=535 RepID=UPI000C79223D|nr:transporter substrate-binding domain-containing protein [Chromobacterium sp. ATCC 53434]AUH53031.1 amino acid ABC transporter substrate-binding protein [Chromobacterium sp. ATCC 53434]